MDDGIVIVNVGGVYYTTRRGTLLNAGNFFAPLLRSTSAAGSTVAEIFVDRDPTHFRHLLNWMRGSRFLPSEEQVLQELLWESDYFCMHDMHDFIQRSKNRFNTPRLLTSLSEDVRAIATAQKERSSGRGKPPRPRH